MATTTPNFGWPVPTSTDLVKDGATAIEALGDSIDASLLDLKGGTTGQVLSKTSNTDMDFTWVTSDDANAIQNTIVDAKGDLIAATAADTPARLAVGNNGETLVADSSTATGLRYQSAYNGNGIINGGFDIWQRGTSIANTASYTQYCADRFQVNRAGLATGATISRQSSGFTSIQYAARVQRDSGNTNTGAIYFLTALETADSYRFAGQAVTISFYARAGANYSSASSALGVRLDYGTGTDQSLGTGFTGQTAVVNQTATLTTSWQRFTYTGTVSASATEIGFYSFYTPVGTAGANDYYEITGIQLELGSVATTFKRSNGAGGTIQGELAACQRYYFRSTPLSSFGWLGSGIAQSTTATSIAVTLPSQMRVVPTSVDFSTLALVDGVTSTAVTACTIDANISSNNFGCVTASVASGLTQYRPYYLRQNSNNAAYIGFSAEL